MRRISIGIVALICIIIAFSSASCGGGGGGSSSPAATPTPVGTIVTGTLINSVTNQPLAGITVTVALTPLSATTDSTGAFSVANVPPGSQSLVFKLNGAQIGTPVAVNVSGTTVSVGTIQVNTEGAPPPPPL